MNFGKLSDITQRMRRNLLFFCGVWLFINFFDVTGVKFSVIEFRTDDIGPVALSTAFKVLIAYHLIAFSWYLHSDWKLWIVESMRLIQEDAIKGFENADTFRKFKSDGRKEYVKTMDNLAKASNDRATEGARARRAILIRLIFFDLGIPWALAGIALIWV